ncbi:NAD(P)-binding protein [Epithele typhae]|uniref:NAD(P)-binding protein n=1 Tax=Epithele typhae TaxID=378194 RepID=UPI0020087B7A|nr:NAD(P)-binding protein [Epithele typhae]KAH9945462.1 NAD(P)-binding protein [Epithele typhae]
MAPVRNGRVLFNEVPTGFPEPDKTVVYEESHTIDLDTVPLNGGVLAKLLVISADPYMRGRMRPVDVPGYIPAFPLGEPIDNFAVSVVLRSEVPEYRPGDYVYGIFLFQHYSVLKKEQIERKVENAEKLPLSLYVGVLGMPGLSAYAPWKKYAPTAKHGDIAFVSAASGAVGATVVQLAKADGYKVIASSGSDEKAAFVKSLGADVSFNYKTTDTAEVLSKEGPIDLYFDNVGGATLEAALANATPGGLFIVSGMISAYNAPPYHVKNLMEIYQRRLRVQGFQAPHLAPKYLDEFLRTFPARITAGDLRWKEHIVRGLENAGQALYDVQAGANFGKCVVRVADE